jgi:hypothetical protein
MQINKVNVSAIYGNGVEEPEETAVAGRRLGKHVLAITNTYAT